MSQSDDPPSQRRVADMDGGPVNMQMKNPFFLFLRRPKGWLVLLLAVFVFHLAAIAWMSGKLRWPGSRSSSDAQDNLISASLQQTESVKASTPQPLEPQATKAEPVPEPAMKEAAPEPAAAPSSDESGGMTASSSVAKAGSKKPPETESVSSSLSGKGSGATASDRVKFAVSAPPSAKLNYRIQARKQEQSLYGTGFIEWKNDGGNFSIEGESSLLFMTVFHFRSKGTINPDYGISPQIYQEKRFRKSETNTHFHPERNRISFSASTKSYPRTGGEQDRSSVVWQLAGIGRRTPGLFKSGVQFPIFVAGTRDAETWNFLVVGSEDVNTEMGRMKAWHLIRKPGTGSRDQTLEVWLAPNKEWYPVKLRHTDRNGDTLEMSIAEIKIAPDR